MSTLFFSASTSLVASESLGIRILNKIKLDQNQGYIDGEEEASESPQQSLVLVDYMFVAMTYIVYFKLSIFYLCL